MARARKVIAACKHPKIRNRSRINRVRRIASFFCSCNFIILIRRRILNSAISKGTLLGFVSNPRFVTCNMCDEEGSNDGKNAIVDNAVHEKQGQKKNHSLCDQQKIVVGVHALFVNAHTFQSLLRFVFGFFHAFKKEEGVSGQDRNSKGSQSIKKIVCGQKYNQEGYEPNQTTDCFEGMKVWAVFKLLKKPVEFLRLSRHFSSLKSLINSTSNITFLTNYAK